MKGCNVYVARMFWIGYSTAFPLNFDDFFLTDFTPSPKGEPSTADMRLHRKFGWVIADSKPETLLLSPGFLSQRVWKEFQNSLFLLFDYLYFFMAKWIKALHSGSATTALWIKLFSKDKFLLLSFKSKSVRIQFKSIWFRAVNCNWRIKRFRIN